MPPRYRRTAITIAGLVLVQAAAIALYTGVSRDRSTRKATGFVAERMTPRDAPPLTFERHDGTTTTLAQMRGKIVMVHFWATWCEPCRDELPGLLALAGTLERSGNFELLAVSVDDDWEEMRTFFRGDLPRAAVRPGHPDAHRTFGASTLPDTYLVDARGQLVIRYAGARDWTTPEAREHLERAIEDHAR